MISHAKEYAPFQVWVFDDPNYEDEGRWVVYLIDHIDFDVTRSHVLAASPRAEHDFGAWFCFQNGSWIDLNSQRIV